MKPKLLTVAGSLFATLLIVSAIWLAVAVGGAAPSPTAPHPLVTPPPVNVYDSGWTPCSGHYCLSVGWTNPVDAGIVHVALSVFYYGTSSGPAACTGGNLAGTDTYAWPTASGAHYLALSTQSLGTANYAYSEYLKLTDGSGTSAATACAQLPETYFLLVPSAPTTLSAASGGSGAVALTWVHNATGSGLTGGNVTEFANSTVCAGAATSNTTVSGAATTKTISGLTNGLPYSFLVAESNATGRGFNSTCVNFTPSAGGGGGVPSGNPIWPLIGLLLAGGFVVLLLIALTRGRGRE